MKNNKKITPFTETPEEGSVSKDYFFRMMSGKATVLSKPYDSEEREVINSFISKNQDISKMNFVVVGAGMLSYLESAFNKVLNYVAIEPLADVFVKKQLKFLVQQFKNIIVIPKKFGDVNKKDIPDNPSVFTFIFNILAYIEHPISKINKIITPGDILIISSWNRTDEAKKVRKEYFDYLNSVEKEVIIDPKQTIGLCNLNNFPFEKLVSYKKHKRIKGLITDILIIYT